MNYWIWFSTLKDIGPIRKLKLLDKYETPENVFNAKEKELLKVEMISQKNVDEIKNSKNLELLKRYEEFILKNEIKIINIQDKAYPQNLRNIYAPPITLFCKGNVNLLKKQSIGIIGCREASMYGMTTANMFASGLSKNGFVIVSGMAKGIDTAGHIGALKENGETIAVLGCGVDIIYPKENINLYHEITKRGLIVSEYIVGTRPESNNFPQRNRIISGISDGVIVVEAQKKSGSMITTDFALEQGKELYVVPGNITSKTSEGTNNLIKEGAKMVTNLNDVLEDFTY